MTERVCPNCGYKAPAHTKMSGPSKEDHPVPGDVCICFGCASPLLMTHDNMMRNPSRDELVEMLAAPEVQLGILRSIYARTMSHNAINNNPPDETG